MKGLILVSLGFGVLTAGFFGVLTFNHCVEYYGFWCWLALTTGTWLMMSWMCFVFCFDEFQKCKKCGIRGEYLVNGLCAGCWYEEYGKGKAIYEIRAELSRQAPSLRERYHEEIK